MVKIFQKIDPRLFSVAIIVSFVKLSLEVVKLWMLLKVKGIVIPVWNVAKIMITGMFLGTFMPTSLSTEIFRAYGFSKYSEQTIHSISAVVVNRFLGLLSLLVIASICSIWQRAYASSIGIVWIVLLFGITLFLIIFGFVKKIRNFINKNIFSHSKRMSSMTTWIRNIGSSFWDYRTEKKILFIVTFLSFVFQCMRVLACYLLALSIGLHLPIGYFFIFIPLVLLFTTIPLSIGGIGMREGGVVYFLGKAGVDSTVALSVSFLWFIAAITVALPGLYFYLKDGVGVNSQEMKNYKKGLGKKSISEE